MAEVGILPLDQRGVELIEGEILDVSPQNHPHGRVTTLVTGLLVRGFGDAYHVRVQLPLVVDDYSEPEPDFAVVTHEQLERGLPHPSQAVLLLEVADTSLAYDRVTKGRLYSRAGIEDYWILNLRDQQVELYREPGPEGYRQHIVRRRGETVTPLARPDLSWTVEQLLG